ncbi:MAG TPA: hypothetical protein VFG66_07225 [Gemmatimonadales bacterium]|nr:hypothetical protein [Gemmatimonadales bacterium]
MRHSVRALVILALTLGASPARAQNPGLPVYNIGVPRGIGLYGDVAFPNDAAGGGTAYGVTARAGFGFLGATATLSSLNPDGPAGSDVSVGGTLNYKLLGGPLVPLSVTLQGGVSYAKPGDALLPGDEVTAYRFPVGVGFALVIPNPVLAIHPWLAPRVDIAYQTTDAGSNTDTNFGLSGGLELNFLNGFGLHAAYDRVFAKDVADPSTFGIGAHYSFRVPGL